jgi:Universal stress protein family
VAQAKSTFLEIDSKLRIGLDLRHEILNTAKEIAADLLVLTTHKFAGWKNLLFGSDAEKILEHAQCPVLILHAQIRLLMSKTKKQFVTWHFLAGLLITEAGFWLLAFGELYLPGTWIHHFSYGGAFLVCLGMILLSCRKLHRAKTLHIGTVQNPTAVAVREKSLARLTSTATSSKRTSRKSIDPGANPMILSIRHAEPNTQILALGSQLENRHLTDGQFDNIRLIVDNGG